MGKSKSSKSATDTTDSNGSSRGFLRNAASSSSDLSNNYVRESTIANTSTVSRTFKNAPSKTKLNNEDDEKPAKLTAVAHSGSLQKGHLQRILEKHVVDNTRGSNSLASAVTSSTASVSGGSTHRSRSNTILSDVAFNNSPDVKSRSNTVSSELDLEFVHYALDTWDLVASSSTDYIPTKICDNTSEAIPVPNNSLRSTSAAPVPIQQGNVGSVTMPSVIEAQKHHDCTQTNDKSVNQSLPVLSSSCDDSVSSFLCRNNTGFLSHTPPIKGTSYEASHFGKRMRSGSVSGRLRSASDLEELGIIDRNQRNMLKDLIISKHSSRADDELQAALDQYEMTGDISGLQRLITGGRLLQKTEAFDLLDDLDLDFLNVDIGNDGRNTSHYDDFERLVDAGTVGLIDGYGQDSSRRDQELINKCNRSCSIPDDGIGELDLFDGDHFGADITVSSSSIPYFQAQSQDHQSELIATDSNSTKPHTGVNAFGVCMGQHGSINFGETSMQHTAASPKLPPKKYPALQDDGIGDIDFNEFTTEEDVVYPESSKLANFTQWSSSLPLHEMQRLRADSIQMFSSLLGGLPSVDGIARETYGKWTNETRCTQNEQSELGSDSQESSGEASEGEDNCETPRTKLKRGRKKSENTIRKEQEAKQRRKERIRRKEDKEREKQERRAQKERERLEREEKEEKMKEQKRLLKETAALAKLEKLMEVEQKKAEKLKEKSLKEKEKEERKLMLKKEMDVVEKVIEIEALRPSTPLKLQSVKEKEEEFLKEKQSEKMEMRKEEARKDVHIELTRKETPSGLGLPRSTSDPNITYRNDEFGLLYVDAPEGWVGAYSPESRKLRIDRFHAKRSHRVWTKTVKYDVRKNFADSRLRVKGRFVKKEDEQLMRDLIRLT